jgi:hypothetical protein
VDCSGNDQKLEGWKLEAGNEERPEAGSWKLEAGNEEQLEAGTWKLKTLADLSAGPQAAPWRRGGLACPEIAEVA